MTKKNKCLMVLSLFGLIGSTCLSYTGKVINLFKTKSNPISRKEGQLNKSNKTASLNAVGEILLEQLDKYVNSNDYSISRIVEMKDFSDNSYVLVEFNPIGYAIYNVSNGDIVECAPTSFSPYLKKESKDLYYLPWVGYFTKTNGKYSNIMSKQDVKDNELSGYQKESKRYHDKAMQTIDEKNIQRTLEGSSRLIRRRKNATMDCYSFGTLIYADTEVPYSWYFKRCTSEFVANDGDSCGYTCISFLLAYSEFFLSKGYFSAYEAEQYITPCYDDEFGDFVPTLDDDFLYEFGTNPSGSNISTLKSAINSFMDGKTKEYTIKTSTGLFTNPSAYVEDGYPSLLGGNLPDDEGGTGTHAVVVYGLYDNGDYLCHYGWNGYTQVILSGLGIFDKTGALAIYNESLHVHNSYFILNGEPYCGCGEWMTC